MTYKTHYDNLINRAKERTLEGYKESHHIIPRCLGGSDDKDNLVNLTAREHFIAHLLLWKIHPNSYGLIKSVSMMCVNGNYQQRSMNRMYSWLKEKFSDEMSRFQTGEGNSQFGTMWIHNLELKESKKIPKSEEIPEGWLKGRKLSWSTEKPCKQCGIFFETNTRHPLCNVCKEKNSSERNIKLSEMWDTRKNEFITLYKKYKSKNKTLKEMGFIGNVGSHSKWADDIIKGI